jgi:hypothetical protein
VVALREAAAAARAELEKVSLEQLLDRGEEEVLQLGVSITNYTPGR